MENLAWIVVATITAGFGGYLGAYLRKKGENLATKEDLAILTQTTKEIEAKIDDEVWNRQRRWEAKRDILIEVISVMCRTQFLLHKIASFNQVTETLARRKPDEFKLRQSEIMSETFEILSNLEKARMLTTLACGDAVVEATNKVAVLLGSQMESVFDRKPLTEAAASEVQRLLGVAIGAIRTELRIEKHL